MTNTKEVYTVETILYKRCNSHAELEQILALQKRNLRENLDLEEKEVEGFVTISHDLEILRKMNATCPHILAKSGNKVVGYALCMHPKHSNDIPLLKPMFKKTDHALKEEFKYMAMGQICIDKAFRRRGIFTGLYKYMQDELKAEYDLIITEVDSDNKRSLGAHYKVGFTDLIVYQSDSRTWHLIQWYL